MHTAFFSVSVVSVALGAVGCGSSEPVAAQNSANGGASVSGGTGTGRAGGTVAKTLGSGGGLSSATGGTVAIAGGSGHSYPPVTGGTGAPGGSHSGNTVIDVMGGALSTGGKWGTGGEWATGGAATGGSAGTGGAALGGAATGGSTGGTATGGKSATGGVAATGGIATGGASAAMGGNSMGGSATSSTATPDPCAASNTLSGGTPHCNENQSGSYGKYEWRFWSNQPNGCLTTYSNPDTFSLNWDESGDVVGMVGFVFDATKTPEELGTFSADFAETHTGTAGGYSYIGVWGWTDTPYVDFYIVDDSYVALPFKPWNTTKFATFQADGGTYDAYYSQGGEIRLVTQIYSVRQASRQCGHISISEHIAQWAKAGKSLGLLSEVHVFVESGGGTGSIDFTMARVDLN